jgi:hypothetical protein
MPDAKSYDNRSLPLDGLIVERVFAAQFDGFGLVLRDAASDETRQGELSFARALVDAEAAALSSLEGLLGRIVREAATDERGALHLVLDTGASMDVEPGDDYEGWELRGPGQLFVVSPTGGGEALVWDSTSEAFEL